MQTNLVWTCIFNLVISSQSECTWNSFTIPPKTAIDWKMSPARNFSSGCHPTEHLHITYKHQKIHLKVNMPRLSSQKKIIFLLCYRPHKPGISQLILDIFNIGICTFYTQCTILPSHFVCSSYFIYLCVSFKYLLFWRILIC